MKKILSLIASVGLVTTPITSMVISCNTSTSNKKFNSISDIGKLWNTNNFKTISLSEFYVKSKVEESFQKKDDWKDKLKLSLSKLVAYRFSATDGDESSQEKAYTEFNKEDVKVYFDNPQKNKEAEEINDTNLEDYLEYTGLSSNEPVMATFYLKSDNLGTIDFNVTNKHTIYLNSESIAGGNYTYVLGWNENMKILKNWNKNTKASTDQETTGNNPTFYLDENVKGELTELDLKVEILKALNKNLNHTLFINSLIKKDTRKSPTDESKTEEYKNFSSEMLINYLIGYKEKIGDNIKTTSVSQLDAKKSFDATIFGQIFTIKCIKGLTIVK